MEVSCQLRGISKKGTARIQLTYCWDGRRLRLSSGEKCLPKDWNEKKQRVKATPGAYADQINPVLERWIKAGEQVHLQARAELRALDVQQMEAAIRRRYAELVAEATGRPVDALTRLRLAEPAFLEYMDQWIEYQQGKVSLRSGRRLSKGYITRLRGCRTEFARFAEARQWPLTFTGMDHAFYAAFQDYALNERQRDVNTFGCDIKRLKGFLSWAMKRSLPVSPHYTDFEAPSIYRGADALTQDELLRLAAIDFDQQAVRAYLAKHLTPAPRSAPGGRPQLTLAEHQQRCQYVRDTMLACCYFGLRISDAQKLSPAHLQGDVVRLYAGKTDGLVVIPFLDDDVFKPRHLVAQYASLGLATCLPYVKNLEDYLPHIQHLAGITRIKLTSRVGRKTFATLKIYQGIPKTQVMLATGHTTESSFNRYLGVNEAELLETFRKTARRLPEKERQK